MSRETLIIHQLDETGDNQVSKFVNKSFPTEEAVELFKESQKTEFVTDQDFANIFTKVATEHKPSTWAELKDKVDTIFSGKLNDRFDRWEDKMALDKSALKELFNG